MAKVNIIIRAFNRLEYTVHTIREIDRLAGYDDYKLIVIDNASSDGTRQWLKSLEIEGYYKIKPLFSDVNLGDFGGTKLGYENLDEDCIYTMQWDNDCTPMTQDFLAKMVEIMDVFPIIGQLMLKRIGVGTVIDIINKQEHNGVIFGDARMVTCVNMQRRSVVDKINFWVEDPTSNVYWDFELNKRMRENGFFLKKIENITVEHDTIQYKKFPKYFRERKNINYTVLNY
ncbi:MAG: glycosyltransferase [Dehalococcoidia bacterium]|jgi:GT2 family glycosyltransferase